MKVSSKYDPLYDYLKGLPGDRTEITLTFSELERLIGMELPASAREHTAWWGAHANHVQANAWLNASFKASPDLVGQRVRFRRLLTSAERAAAFMAWRNGPAVDSQGAFLERLATGIRTSPIGPLFTGLEKPMDPRSVSAKTGFGYDYRISVLKDSDDNPAVLVQMRVEVVVPAPDPEAAGKRIVDILEPYGALRWFPEERIGAGQVVRGTGKVARGTLDWARAREADLIAWAIEQLQLLAMGVHGRIN